MLDPVQWLATPYRQTMRYGRATAHSVEEIALAINTDAATRKGLFSLFSPLKTSVNIVIMQWKIYMVNKKTIVNMFVLHTFHRNITRLAIRARNTTNKIENLKRR